MRTLQSYQADVQSLAIGSARNTVCNANPIYRAMELLQLLGVKKFLGVIQIQNAEVLGTMS